MLAPGPSKISLEHRVNVDNLSDLSFFEYTALYTFYSWLIGSVRRHNSSSENVNFFTGT